MASAHTHSGGVDGAEADNKALLDSLDHAIAHTAQAVQRKERRIALLRRHLAMCHDDAQRYDASYRLFNEYKAYMNDSAMHYIDQCVCLATRLGQTQRLAFAQALMALQCSATGNYAEASTVLSHIRPDKRHSEAYACYLWAKRHLYGELAYYTAAPHLKAHYARLAQAYEDSVTLAMAPTDDRLLQLKETVARHKGLYQQALDINDQRMKQVAVGSHAYGIVCFYRAQTFKAMGRSAHYMHCLALSALCDARLAIMDQGAMWELANGLDDSKRKYRYIKFAWHAAEAFNTPLRSRQIMPVLSATEDNYQRGLATSNRLLTAAIAVAAVLLALLLALLAFAIRQNKRLAQAHHGLQAANDALVVSNQHLKQAYGALNESNRMKEMYIGRFLRLCALYADKVETLRKKVARLVKNRELNKLNALLQDDGNAYIGELYEYFDSAFLKLFPHFVDEFNALLKPSERIVPPDPTHLTTQIRIFALIRLGIDDSSKIAEFLHYSVNTIYNYRAKVKNGALCHRDDFERKVKEIGMTI